VSENAPIVLIPNTAGVRKEDVDRLTQAGLLVVRAKDPSGIRVMSTESVVADGHIVRAMLDMLEPMTRNPNSYEYNRHHMSAFTASVVRLMRAQLEAREGTKNDK